MKQPWRRRPGFFPDGGEPAGCGLAVTVKAWNAGHETGVSHSLRSACAKAPYPEVIT